MFVLKYVGIRDMVVSESLTFVLQHFLIDQITLNNGMYLGGHLGVLEVYVICSITIKKSSFGARGSHIFNLVLVRSCLTLLSLPHLPIMIDTYSFSFFRNL